MQYQSVIDKLKKQCRVNNDNEFEMKVSVSFEVIHLVRTQNFPKK